MVIGFKSEMRREYVSMDWMEVHVTRVVVVVVVGFVLLACQVGCLVGAS